MAAVSHGVAASRLRPDVAIVTGRLVCRGPQRGDLDALHALFLEPSSRVFMQAAEAPSISAVLNWLRARLLNFGASRALVVALNDDASLPIGVIEFGDDGLRTETHFLVAEGQRSKGYMTEALSAAMERHPRLSPFVATIDAENRSAERMLAKCGFALREVKPALRHDLAMPPTSWDCLVFEKGAHRTSWPS